MTELHFMNIHIRMLVSANGEAATSCIPEARSEASCSPAANYWLSVYHVDGIRMDAISRIIYWQGEPARGVNNNAVDFIREMNRGLKALHPTAMLSAEDSTSFEGVTKPADQGGLGFDYKWDMGWMNDTLELLPHRTGIPKPQIITSLRSP